MIKFTVLSRKKLKFPSSFFLSFITLTNLRDKDKDKDKDSIFIVYKLYL